MTPSISSKDGAKEQTSVQVALRIRPLTEQDLVQPRFSKQRVSDVLAISSPPHHNVVNVVPQNKQFTFDHVFGPETSQEHVYNECVPNLLQKFTQGYNATILAYGQTSSGKTYTMGTASENDSPETLGIIPRAIADLFDTIHRASNGHRPNSSTSSIPTRNGRATPTSAQRPQSPSRHNTRTTISVSFIEIYNEELIDLLNPDGIVSIREDPQGHIYWSGVREVFVNGVDEVMQYLALGSLNRQVGATDMNEKSSRSHAIFSVSLRQEKGVGGSLNGKIGSPATSRVASPTPLRAGRQRKSSILSRSSTSDEAPAGEITVISSKFHFVDLAGSERLKQTSATGDRIKEGISINSGLLALGNVISALGDPTRKMTHVPYRDSKLTRLLQDSLGGSAQTLMIACVSPAEYNLTETINTLKYANRARNIKNNASVNCELVFTPEAMRAKILKLEAENARLRGEQPMHEGGVGADLLQRQVQELQRSLDELSEKYIQVTTELKEIRRRDDSKTENSSEVSFQEMVEPVVQEYENAVTSVESELAMTRAALRHSEAMLREAQEQLERESNLSETRINELRLKLKEMAMRHGAGAEQAKNKAGVGESLYGFHRILWILGMMLIFLLGVLFGQKWRMLMEDYKPYFE
ncbi:uncharacterized protein VTP21DRAFT_702 [Calcarisporiella thermophila]|uniref:uncharacterized protein n=1 Tax=Calcarisporiella thermophila TaxID=911321 RepID=UPI003743DC54